MLATIDFFETRGKATLKGRPRARPGLPRVRQARAHLRDLLTPGRRRRGDPDKRWDTARICAFSEITGFYGLAYWYTWQVTILGLGPIWQSDNAAARRRAAELLEDGAIFAFGLSEKRARRRHLLDRHGPHARRRRRLHAQRRQVLHRQRQPGRHGLGLRAPRRRRGPRRLRLLRGRQQHPAYQLVKNVVNSQNYVSEFRLEDYPVPRRGHPAHRQGRVRRRAEHRQRRQVQPRLRLDRHLRARLLRGDHPRRRPASSTATR